MLRANKKKEDKPNKFAPVSPAPFIELAKEKPEKASKKLRERYEELTNDAQASAIGGIYKDERSKGWHELAVLLSDTDPALAKSIYMPLLTTRNWPISDGVSEDLIADMRLVAQELYDLENKAPETKEEAKLQVLFVLVNSGSPDQRFWQTCLEEMSNLAIKVAYETGSYGEMIAHAVFYADHDDVLQKKALDALRELFKETQLFRKSSRPAISKAIFLKRFYEFCIDDDVSFRNKSFASNENSKLLAMVQEIFWDIVEDALNKKSTDALPYLEYMMMVNDLGMAQNCAKKYIENFKKIAQKDPERTAKDLQSLAGYSTCNFSKSTTGHQNDLLLDVFDATIEILFKIDRAYSHIAMQGYMGSHKTMPYRIKKKHSNKLLGAR